MVKRLCIFFLSLLPYAAAYADDYLVEVKNDEKILHIDELKLPSTATLEDVIYLLPELLARPDYVLLNNYDIEVNGFSIGSSKDAFFSNLHAYSIDKITISDSPANSYNNNGQGGTIKIDLKDPSAGFSGNADITANSSWSVIPSVQLDFKNRKENFSMHIFAAGDVHQSSFDYVRYHLDPQGGSEYYEYTDTTRKKFNSQLLRTYMKYAPNERNRFEFLVSVDRVSDWSRNVNDGSKPVSDLDDNYNADANVTYALTTDSKGSEFKAEAKFGYHPMDEYQDVQDFRLRQTYGKNWSIVGTVQYKSVFLEAFRMFFGADYNLSNRNSDFHENDNYVGPQGPGDYSSYNGTVYLSPFVKAEATLGKWSLKGSLEYQFYDFEVLTTNISEKFSNIQHDFTGSFYANWQFVSNQNLRFSLEKRIKRPSVFQMTPDWSFDTSSYQYIQGNEELRPMNVYDLGVDYIFDIRASRGLFTLNAGLDYMFVSDIVKSTVISNQYSVRSPEYLTYYNSGTANILLGNLFLYYRSGILSVSAGGNVFFNRGVDGDERTSLSYYNLSLQPTLSFPSEWKILARAEWYGDIESESSHQGGFSVASLDVAKTWGHVTVGVQGSLPFPLYTLDSSADSGGSISYLYYRPSYAYAGLKFSYRF